MLDGYIYMYLLFEKYVQKALYLETVQRNRRKF